MLRTSNRPPAATRSVCGPCLKLGYLKPVVQRALPVGRWFLADGREGGRAGFDGI